MSETPTQYISERQLGAVREDIPLKTKLMTMNKNHWEGIKKKNRKSKKLFATFYACFGISCFITFLNDFCHFPHVPAQDVSSLFLTFYIGILSDNIKYW